jgi:hypothetical protein
VRTPQTAEPTPTTTSSIHDPPSRAITAITNQKENHRAEGNRAELKEIAEEKGIDHALT